MIVCDDGSTDQSEKVLEGFGGTIVLLRKKNGGGASALNHALAAATGDFVAVLDADDFYDPDRIAAIGSAAAARPDLDIVTTDAWLEQGGERIGTHRREPVRDSRAARRHSRHVLSGRLAGRPP